MFDGIAAVESNVLCTKSEKMMEIDVAEEEAFSNITVVL
jgi:hypothetical protein